jgi:hypothetical protein
MDLEAICVDGHRADFAVAFEKINRSGRVFKHNSPNGSPGQLRLDSGGDAFTAELDQFNKHEIEEIRPFVECGQDDMGSVAYEIGHIRTVTLHYRRDDLMRRVLIDQNGAEDLLLAIEVIVNTAQRDPGAFGDLPHGGAVVALVPEVYVGCLQDRIACCATLFAVTVCHRSSFVLRGFAPSSVG